MIRGIADRATFSRLRGDCVQVRSADLRMRFVPEPGAADFRIAYAIPRKVGSAVVRNRIRRRIRGALEEHGRTHGSLPTGAALVIVHPGARDRSYPQLRRQVQELMDKLPTRAEP